MNPCFMDSMPAMWDEFPPEREEKVMKKTRLKWVSALTLTGMLLTGLSTAPSVMAADTPTENETVMNDDSAGETLPEIPSVSVSDPASTVKHVSFDELQKWTADAMFPENAGMFVPGQAANWDGIADISGNSDVKKLKAWGWVAMNAENFEFGYIVDDTTYVI